MEYTKYDERICSENYTLISFFKSRFLYIYLTYFVTVLFSFATQGPRNIIDSLKDLLLITPSWFKGGSELINYPAWFLCGLAIAYLVYFIIGKLRAKYNFNKTYLYISVLLLYRVLMEYELNVPFITGTDCFAVVCFLIGCLTHVFYSFLENCRCKKKKFLFVPFSLVTIVLWSGCIILGYEKVIGSSSELGFSITIVPLIVLSLALNTPLNCFLGKLKPISLLGKRSMYWYLWHVPLYSVVIRFVNIGAKKLEIYYVIGFWILLIVWCELFKLLQDKIIDKFIMMNEGQ